MSQERVERLEALLSRVQDNRKRTRTPAGLGTSMPGPQIAKAAPIPEPAKPAPVAEVAKPAPVARPAPAAPAVRTMPPAPPAPPAAVPKPQPIARPAIAEAPAPTPRAEVQPPRSPEAQPVRRGQDRSATPLEMAVAELDLASATAQNKAEARREPVAAAPAPAPVPVAAPVPIAPAIAPEEAFEPRVIEPEPMREPARPIAQVVSRHAPQVDATFGAMLKRSLSLRPH
ncbi:MAG TPA: hypothetical protein VJV78_00990 [Polyangiales bacterium]|nr:hypothetical protein [Polyangiales bacterium]